MLICRRASRAAGPQCSFISGTGTTELLHLIAGHVKVHGPIFVSPRHVFQFPLNLHLRRPPGPTDIDNIMVTWRQTTNRWVGKLSLSSDSISLLNSSNNASCVGLRFLTLGPRCVHFLWNCLQSNQTVRVMPNFLAASSTTLLASLWRYLPEENMRIAANGHPLDARKERS